MNKTLPRYYDNCEYLQLHDNHTVWKLTNDQKTDAEFFALVNNAVMQFENETDVQLYLLGRSGRHVCVDDSPANSRNYKYLKDKALKLEKWVIDEFNSNN